MGNIYSVAFSSINATGVVSDLFYVKGSSLSGMRILGLTLGQVAAALSSSAIENLTVSIYRGSSLSSTGDASGGTTSSAGTLVVPVNINQRSEATASFLAYAYSTAPGSSGVIAELLHSSPWNTQRQFVWRPYKEALGKPTVSLGERLQVRLSAPAATIVVGGTLLLEEIGRIPGATAE